MATARHRRSPSARQKRRAPWAAYLWPGLPHLWIRGSWAGLLLAIGFTVLLHVTVLATLVWPEWLEPNVVTGCGTVLGLLWAAALWETRGELRRLAAERAALEEESDADADVEFEGEEPTADSRQPIADGQRKQDKIDELFAEAQTYYLQADWVETERTLLALLRLDREDIEAQLMLATLWRRLGRTREARRRLAWLARREAADAWRHEIQAEQAWCDAPAAPAEEVREESQTSNDEPGEPPTLQAVQPTTVVAIAPERADRNAA